MFLIIRGASYLIVHIFFKIFRRVWCVIMISNWNCMFMRLQKFFWRRKKQIRKMTILIWFWVTFILEFQKWSRCSNHAANVFTKDKNKKCADYGNFSNDLIFSIIQGQKMPLLKRRFFGSKYINIRPKSRYTTVHFIIKF